MYTDKELVNLLEVDLEKGAALLFEQYGGLIWAVSSKRLANTEDVKECVNDVFADFCLRYKKYDVSKGGLKNYLCLIAERKAVDKFRKNMRDEKVIDFVAHKKKTEEEALEANREEIEKLKIALEQISPIDSQILRMKYYGGMTYREIAQQLNMNYEVVKKRSQRSKRLLYLIIIGMVLALLIACASVIFKKYYYSSTSGFIWSEGEVYELVNKGEYLEKDNLRFMVTDAFCENEMIKIILELEPIEKTDLEGYDLLKAGHQALDEEAYIYTSTHPKNRYRFMFNTNGFNVDMENCKYELDFNIQEEVELGKLVVFFGLEGSGEVKLELKPMETIEYEEVSAGVMLPGNSLIMPGPAFVSEEFTIVNMYSYELGAYKVSPILLNSYYGIGSHELGKATLCDEEGNTYESIRIMGNAMEGQTEYVIYFDKTPEGKYSLILPYVCLTKEGESTSNVLELPTGEKDHVDCDLTFQFEDGFSIHVTGITRKEFTQVMVDEVKDDTIVKKHTEYYWDYVLEYEETLEENNMQFCVALPGIVDNPDQQNISHIIDSNLDPAIRVLQELDVNSIEVYFQNPVFIWDQEVVLDVTVTEVTE